MAAEDQTPCTKPRPDKTKKRKKPKRDKWGQPIAAAAEEPSVEPEQEHPAGEVETAVQVEKEEEEATAAAEGYEPGKVVASGLPYTTIEADIRKLFEFYGPLQSVQLSRFPDSGNFRGLAFICFESEEDAIKSLELDGFKIGSRYMRVERCRVTAASNKKRKAEFQTDPKKSAGCLSAYVGNLSWNVTEKDLRDFFRSSKIASVRFAIDKRTGASRGFCHVDFQDDESLEKAVAMNQSELQGAVLVCSARHAKAHVVELGPVLAPSPTYIEAMSSSSTHCIKVLRLCQSETRPVCFSEPMVMKPTNQTIHLDHALVLVHSEGHENKACCQHMMELGSMIRVGWSVFHSPLDLEVATRIHSNLTGFLGCQPGTLHTCAAAGRAP